MTTYDDHVATSNCESHGENPGEKSAISTSTGSKLYGTTPRSRYRVAPFDARRKDFSKGPVGRAIDMFRADPQSVNQLDFNDFDDGFEPGHIADDYVGPAMELVSVMFLPCTKLKLFY